MRTIRFPAILLVTIAMSPFAAPAAAQSLFATRGLGVPNQPLDARARALGGVGTGLMGLNASIVNPADAIGLSRRALAASLQPTSGEAELGGESGDFSSTRFPTVRLLVPLGTRFGLSVGYGSVFEQSWSVATIEELPIGEDGELVEVRDEIEANGGISRIEVGLAYAIVPTLSVGVAGGVYTGQLDRTIARTFDDPNLAPFEHVLRFSFSGPHATVGARWDPLTVLRLAAAFTVADELEVEVEEGPAAGGDWKLPMRLNAGASGALTNDLSVGVGVQRAWGGEPADITDPDVLQLTDPSSAEDTWRVGGGIEYTGLRSGSSVFPIRAGYATEDLPYHFADESAASEHAFAFGAGARFGAPAEQGGGLNAALDMTFERGERTGLESAANPSGLAESFWRFTFSLTLLGF